MKIPSFALKRLLAPALVATTLIATAHADGADVKLEFLSSGAMKKIGGYMPQRLTLSSNQPAGIKKLPPGLAAPMFGELKLGPAEAPGIIYVVLDEPEGKPPRLFVDANHNGDLTDDPDANWVSQTYKMPAIGATKSAPKEMIEYHGVATLEVPYGAETLKLHVPMYRFDKHDPQRAALANVIFYYGDYAWTGEVKLGDKSYAALLHDPLTTGDFRASEDSKSPAALMIDVNGDGKFDMRHESFPVNKPFNIGGTTYEIAGMTASGGSFQIVKSSKTVAETVPPPSLTAGNRALPFNAKTTDGKEIAFPAAYKGKLVILDFWATWCGPCVGELPHLTAAYEKFHPQGLEVLGISLDQKDAGEKLAKFTKEHNMPWAQVYDGNWWKAEVATNYFIESIPHAFLVDGDTGKIVAEGNSLRGEQLAKTLQTAFEKRAP